MRGALAGDGRSATIGLQNAAGDSRLQYFFGDDKSFPHGPIQRGLAIMFEPLRKVYLPVIMR